MNSRVLEVPSTDGPFQAPLSKMQITWSLLRVMNHAEHRRYALRISDAEIWLHAVGRKIRSNRRLPPLFQEPTGEESRKNYLETCFVAIAHYRCFDPSSVCFTTLSGTVSPCRSVKTVFRLNPISSSTTT